MFKRLLLTIFVFSVLISFLGSFEVRFFSVVTSSKFMQLWLLADIRPSACHLDETINISFIYHDFRFSHIC